MLIFFFLLKDNCFTEFCCFLSNFYINQPYVYIYPLPFEPPYHLPPHPIPLDWYRAPVEFPKPYSKFPLAIYFTYVNVSFHVTLSIYFTLSSPLPMSISLFSISVYPLLTLNKFLLRKTPTVSSFRLSLSSKFFKVIYESDSCSVTSNSVIPWTIEFMEFSRPEYWNG